MGKAEGAWDGPRVGDGVGTVVGARDGEMEGATVVGARVGNDVGEIIVGVPDGTPMGDVVVSLVAVGIVVIVTGEKVGNLVGEDVTRRVGEGANVSSVLFRTVGASVGTYVEVEETDDCSRTSM